MRRTRSPISVCMRSSYLGFSLHLPPCSSGCRAAIFCQVVGCGVVVLSCCCHFVVLPYYVVVLSRLSRCFAVVSYVTLLCCRVVVLLCSRVGGRRVYSRVVILALCAVLSSSYIRVSVSCLVYLPAINHLRTAVSFSGQLGTTCLDFEYISPKTGLRF